MVEAYCPIVKKHMNDEYTPEQKAWQQVCGLGQRKGWLEAMDLQDGELMGAGLCFTSKCVDNCTCAQL